MKRQVLAAIRVLLVLTILTGLAYPLAVTGIAQVVMKGLADGSLVTSGGEVVGSSLIGQAFNGAQWFHGRPDPYDPRASGPSNLGPTNRVLLDGVLSGIAHLRSEEGLPATAPIPADAVTTGGSGLDPDISVAFALMQAPRVARTRGLPVSQVIDLVARQTAGRTAGILGEPRVNVLLLNIALQRLASGT